MPPPLSFVKPIKVVKIKEGEVYRDDSLGLCVEVPEGALSEGCYLKLELGVCLHGPFLLPPGTTRISPVLMIRSQENTTLRKPIKVTLPHIIRESTVTLNTLDIQVTKAAFEIISPNGQYQFSDTAPDECHVKMGYIEGKSYATFHMSHFCFVTLRAEINSQAALAYGYCICPLYPTSQSSTGRFTYILALTFNIEPCIEVIS